LDQDGQIRISDLGLAADISKGPIKQCSGTRGYWPPEVILGKSGPGYTTEPDWFTVGVTTFALVSDKLPFKGKTSEEVDEAAKTQQIDFSEKAELYPQVMQDFINACCEKDYANRLGCGAGKVEEIKGHAYFAGFDWGKLEAGTMEAPIKPDPNDINAPSADEIGGFKDPADVTFEASDQEKFKNWPFMNPGLWREEMAKDLKKGGSNAGGGGGCCTIL